MSPARPVLRPLADQRGLAETSRRRDQPKTRLRRAQLGRNERVQRLTYLTSGFRFYTRLRARGVPSRSAKRYGVVPFGVRRTRRRAKAGLRAVPYAGDSGRMTSPEIAACSMLQSGSARVMGWAPCSRRTRRLA